MDIPAAYVDLMKAVGAYTGFSNPVLHIHAGLMVYVVSQLVLSERRASVLGLAWVAFFTLLNEVLQATHYGDPRWPDTIGDVIVTMFWPTVIVVLGRYRRHRWNRTRARRAEKSGEADLALYGLQPQPKVSLSIRRDGADGSRSSARA